MRIILPSSSSPEVPPPSRKRLGDMPQGSIDTDKEFINRANAVEAAMDAYNYSYLKKQGTDLDHAANAVLIAIQDLCNYFAGPPTAQDPNALAIYNALFITKIPGLPPGSTFNVLCHYSDQKDINAVLDFFESYNQGKTSVFAPDGLLSLYSLVWDVTEGHDEKDDSQDVNFKSIVESALNNIRQYSTATTSEQKQLYAGQFAEDITALIGYENTTTQSIDGRIVNIMREINSDLGRNVGNLGTLIKNYMYADSTGKATALTALIAGLDADDGNVVTDLYSALNGAAYYEQWPHGPS